jgi:hypothetical protein
MTINSVSKQLVKKLRATKSRSIYPQVPDIRWWLMNLSEGYMSPEFLNKVKALQNQIQ